MTGGTAGHRPTPLDLGTQWAVEGTTASGERTVLLIEHDEIVAVGDVGREPDVVLADHLLLLPGFIDIHVHCRDDPGGDERYKEDFDTATHAALHGGVTLVGDMPNNPQPPVDRQSYDRKRDEADAKAVTEVVLYAGVTADHAPFSKEIPYKCYWGPSVGDLHLAASGSESPLSRYRDHFVAFHAEDHEILEASRDAAAHEDRRPAEAEAKAVADIAELATQYCFHAHIAHLSSAAGLYEVRRARRRGVPMTCEVAPHHLFFDRENRRDFPHGEWLQMNPPLRTAADREALREALLTGEIDAIATDHAPHSLEENERGISGVPLLDTFGPFLTLLAEQGFSWDVLVERASAAPARLFRRFTSRSYGALEAGRAAAFTVVDPTTPWTVTAADLSTRSGWSPFESVTFPGRIAYTASRGRLYAMK